MRKVHGIKNLMVYLRSVGFPMTEHTINDLIMKREIPHSRPMKDLLIFDLNHIDWWINEKRKN